MMYIAKPAVDATVMSGQAGSSMACRELQCVVPNKIQSRGNAGCVYPNQPNFAVPMQSRICKPVSSKPRPYSVPYATKAKSSAVVPLIALHARNARCALGDVMLMLCKVAPVCLLTCR